MIFLQQLEMELKKLQTQIQDAAVNFDDALAALFSRKIKTEMVIYQEELKILRLKHSLLLEEELNNHEDELNTLLEFKKELKVGLLGEFLMVASDFIVYNDFIFFYLDPIPL